MRTLSGSSTAPGRRISRMIASAGSHHPQQARRDPAEAVEPDASGTSGREQLHGDEVGRKRKIDGIEGMSREMKDINLGGQQIFLSAFDFDWLSFSSSAKAMMIIYATPRAYNGK